jgi:hypothetical protein
MTKRAAFRQSGLVGRWIHAHERDTDAARVYVGPDVKLGLSRGRTIYEFKNDGSFVESGPGPTDRTTARRGRASAEDGVLVLMYSDGTERQLRFECAVDGTLHLLR